MNPAIENRFNQVMAVMRDDGLRPLEAVEQFSFLLYLKLVDLWSSPQTLFTIDASTGRGETVPRPIDKYLWRNWRSMHGSRLLEFVAREVFPFMGSLVWEYEQTADFFKDARLLIQHPQTLMLVLDFIDRLDLEKMPLRGRGALYEYVLSHLDRLSVGLEFRTPANVRRIMVKLASPTLGEAVYDPACGTGGFLVDAVDFMLRESFETNDLIATEHSDAESGTRGAYTENGSRVDSSSDSELPTHIRWQLEGTTFGVDVSRQMTRLAIVNLMMHGLHQVFVRRANSLSEVEGLASDELRRKYDVIFCNPPFSGILPKDIIREDLNLKTNKADLLFLALIIDSIRDGGRAAIVVPEAVLFSTSRSHLELRKRLVFDCDLLAVVSLPAGVFRPYSGVKSSILFLRRPKGSRLPATEHVWFYEMAENERSGGDSKISSLLGEADIDRFLYEWNHYKSAGMASRAGIEAPMSSQGPRSWVVPVAAIEETTFSLSASRYRPEPIETTRYEDPAAIIEDMLAVEESIRTDLKSLQKMLDT